MFGLFNICRAFFRSVVCSFSLYFDRSLFRYVFQLCLSLVRSLVLSNLRCLVSSLLIYVFISFDRYVCRYAVLSFVISIVGYVFRSVLL